MYCFFPETRGLQLEDVDHLFERGGLTGGVLTSKGGMTVKPGWHTTHPNTEGVEKTREDAMGIENLPEKSLDV